MKRIYRQLGILMSLGFAVSLIVVSFAYLQVQETNNPGSQQLTLLFWGVAGLVATGVLSIALLYVAQNASIEVIYAEKVLETEPEENLHSNTHSDSEGSEGQIFSVRKLEKIIIENQYNKKQLLDEFLRSLCNQIVASVGLIYLTKLLEDDKILEIVSTYAYYNPNPTPPSYEFGQGLVGQVAKNGKLIQVEAVPENYIQVVSGLGKANPNYLMLFPIKNEENEILGVIELASFHKFAVKEEKYLNDVALLLAKEIETNEYQKLSL